MPHLDQTDSDAASLPGETIVRSQQGDVNAFRQLVGCYQRYAFALAFRIVCDEDDAHDIVQETFIRVWKHLRSYNPERKFTTWLYRIVVNLSYDRLKAEGRKLRVFTPISKVDEGTFRDTAMPVDTALINKDLGERIKAIAQGLPRKQRLVFVLRDLQDLPVEEVAEILGMSHESVKTNLCFARRRIRLRLEGTEIQG